MISVGKKRKIVSAEIDAKIARKIDSTVVDVLNNYVRR